MTETQYHWLQGQCQGYKVVILCLKWPMRQNMNTEPDMDKMLQARLKSADKQTDMPKTVCTQSFDPGRRGLNKGVETRRKLMTD